MKSFVSSNGLFKALRAEGFDIPENCVTARIVMGDVESPLAIETMQFIEPEDAEALGRAFLRLGKEARAAARLLEEAQAMSASTKGGLN